jgi:hypothetical protein
MDDFKKVPVNLKSFISHRKQTMGLATFLQAARVWN